MRWQDRERSENVEDRRGTGARPSGGRRMAVGGGMGIGGLLILIVLAFLSKDPAKFLQDIQKNGGNVGFQPGGPQGIDPDRDENLSPEERKASDELADFVAVVLRDTEVVWGKILQEQGETYRKPTLVLFTDAVDSACGYTESAVGPFYCPADQKVYLDLGFFEEMKTRFRAPGDFAQAYVVAHEVGHHVQNLLGISDQVHSRQRGLGEAEANDLSVRLELQADFFAGVWAHHAEKQWRVLEPGDIEEALRCASAIGDDRLQKISRGFVVPDSFTHGSSEQRQRWFHKGLTTGDLRQGDTFSARSL